MKGRRCISSLTIELCNAAIALGNSGCAEAIPVLEKALEDQEPLIREAATWALEQLRDER